MRHVAARAPGPDFALVDARRTDWDVELSAVAALDRHEQRLRELVANVGPGSDSPGAASERIRVLTRLINGLSRATVTDSLTGLRNRQGFLRDGSLLLSQAAIRYRCAIAFYFDVDRLKEVNDDAGHAAGDDLLRCAARALAATFRANDIVGRLGGDEFAVITLARRDDATSGILERLGRNLQRINASRDAWPLELSCGVAVAEPGTAPTLGPLLDRADRLMYQDKRARSSEQFRLVDGGRGARAGVHGAAVATPPSELMSARR